MRKELNVIGLDCAHCALTLEKYLEKVEGVKSCTINFSTSKIYLDVDENDKDIIKKIHKTAKEVNPTVKIVDKAIKDKKHIVIDIMLLIVGIIVGVCGLLFFMQSWLKYLLVSIAIVLMGYKTFCLAIIQLKTFKVNENTLIVISVVGAIALGEIVESVMVVGLYSLGKILESIAVNYSRKSISSLISTQPEYAYLLDKENVKKKVKPETLEVGDKIIVSSGEKVAVDGVIIDGQCYVDKRHLTGEATPQLCKKGDFIESGSIVLDSILTIKVTAKYVDSAISKILNLVEEASNRKSKTETIVSKFSRFYTLTIIVLSIIVLLVLGDVSTAIYRGLVFLVVACPCAFAISVPLTYFSGIGKCSSKGILVKGSNYLDSCAKLDRIVFDKTGTITTGKFIIKNIEYKKGFKEKEVLKLVASGEKNSMHPVAQSICEYYDSMYKGYYKISKFKEITGKGLEFVCKGKKYFIGRDKKNSSETYVVLKEDNKVVGKIYLIDEIKAGVKSAIAALSATDMKITMLSGDGELATSKVAGEVGITEFKGSLYPKDKYNILKGYIEGEEKIAFVGDGINDAPALTLSDVGIGMGIMGSSATIENSDIVIADDDLSKIPTLINISKKTKRIALSNIIFAGITKITFLTLGALGITGMLFAVFADVGVTLLAILNSLRVLMYKDKNK